MLDKLKPINIIYEIIAISAIIIAYFNGLFPMLGWKGFHIAVFLIGIISIVTRAVFKRKETRIYISTFYFSYIFGIYLWSLFSITYFNHLESEVNLINILSIGISIFATGFVISLAGVFTSAVIKGFIRQMVGIQQKNPDKQGVK